jgi:glycosyltransferase involved in cell wall biosynthesis
MTVNCVAHVLNDERVSEIIIVDDCSTDDSYEKLQWYFRDTPKVKLSRNQTNLDCYFNKHKSVMKASNEFCTVWDSDNNFGTDYIDALFDISEWGKHTMYIPEFASPHFSAKQWSGLEITKENVAQYAHTNLMTNLNAFNLFMNRDEFLRIWDGTVNPNTSDSLWVSFCWLKAGNKIKVTPNLIYQHYISSNNDGHYQLNYRKSIEFHEELMCKIRELK